jgi:hypothetical protein
MRTDGRVLRAPRDPNDALDVFGNERVLFVFASRVVRRDRRLFLGD